LTRFYDSAIICIQRLGIFSSPYCFGYYFYLSWVSEIEKSYLFILTSIVVIPAYGRQAEAEPKNLESRSFTSFHSGQHDREMLHCVQHDRIIFSSVILIRHGEEESRFLATLGMTREALRTTEILHLISFGSG